MFKFRAAKLIAGESCRNRVGEVVRKIGEKVVLITGTKTGNTVFCREIIKSLEAEGITVSVWKGVSSPSDDVVNKGFNYVISENPDVFVAFGGGSVIDTAKMINACYTLKKPLNAITPFEFRNKLKVKVGLPLIAIPTTFGTGSETTCAAVIEVNGVKRAFLNEALLPDFAILDWEISAPKRVAASAGMDAIMHAFEAYTCIESEKFENCDVYCGSNELTDSLAENALKLLRHLPEYVNEGKNAKSVALGSHMAGIAFGNAGVHFAHAASYPISKMTGEAHGVSVACVGQALLEFLKSVKYESVSEKAYKVEEILGRISDIRRAVGLPSLREMGIGRDKLPELAEKILEIERLLAFRPEVMNGDNVTEILKIALDES